jgi:hypothetical protein
LPAVNRSDANPHGMQETSHWPGRCELK